NPVLRVRKRFRLHVQLEGTRIGPGEEFLEVAPPARYVGREDVETFHGGTPSARANRRAADESQPGVVKIVPVEVVDANRRGAGTDEPIDDRVVEDARRPDVAVG